jgi:hypothetical protein
MAFPSFKIFGHGAPTESRRTLSLERVCVSSHMSPSESLFCLFFGLKAARVYAMGTFAARDKIDVEICVCLHPESLGSVHI